LHPRPKVDLHNTCKAATELLFRILLPMPQDELQF